MSATTLPPTDRRDVQAIRQRAEAALREDRLDEVEPLLEHLVRLAPDGSEPSLFAHRHLAEIRLERKPWASALHLRRVLKNHPDDHIAHALMGLCQALLGNFHAAVSAYRRAVQIQPKNPWYNHNLGHLLDVALGRSSEGLPHLKRAYEGRPNEDEIQSSLGHCLAHCGDLEGGRRMMQTALRLAPHNANHREILAWIEKSLGLSAVSSSRATERLVERMAEAGYPQALLDQARGVFEAVAARAPEVSGDAALAAIEFLVVRSRGKKGVSRASVARRHGVSPASLGRRLVQIEAVLRAS